MVTVLEAITEFYRSAACFSLGNVEEAARWTGRIFQRPAAVQNGIAALRRTVCNGDPDDDPIYPVPFEGGQCPGPYTVFITGISRTIRFCSFPSASGPITGNTYNIGPVMGPIREIGWEPTNENNFTCPNGEVLRTTARFFMVGADGNKAFSKPITPSDAQGEITDVSFTTDLFRSDGGPNDCGNPPPDLPPVGDITYEGDITYNIDESTEITVPITGIFAPVYVDVDGRISAPISFDLGGVSFTGKVNLAPTFNVELFPIEITGGGGGIDDPDDFPPAPAPDDEPVNDPEPLEERIIGVIVRSVIASDAVPSGILATNIPNIYVPRLASVSFAIATNGATAWTPDIDVKNANCYIPCPAPQGAVDFGVSPQQGVTVTARAVRGIPLTST